MAVRDDRGDVKQTTAGFRGPLMVQSLTSAKSKFLSLTNYSYDDDDVKKIVSTLKSEISRLQKRFETSVTENEETFKL